MARFVRTIPRASVQVYSFGLDPLVDGQTDAALTPADTAIGPIMPWAGSVIALSVQADEAAGAGVSSFDAKKDSTQFSIDLSLAADATEAYDTSPPGTYAFAAGASLGATYTSGTLTTNAGVRVDVYVLFNDVTV